MQEKQALGMAYLSHGQLGNHNAGEGGSQLSTLKMYDNYPYISGQALRHAVRDAVREEADGLIECTPEDACGRIGECPLCDLLGYMNTDLTDEDGPPNKRVSPLRMTPAVGQQGNSVTNDMVVQFGVGGSVKKDEDSDSDHGNSIGYRELIEDVYRGSWMIDATRVGRREDEYMDGDEDAGNRYNVELEDHLNGSERTERVQMLLDALQNHCHLAGQARHMADFMPDLAVATSLPTYNQRVANALHLNDDKELNTNALESVLRDIVEQGGTVYVSGTYNPEVLSNWDEVQDVVDSFGDSVQWVDSVTECYDRLKDHV